MCSCRMKIMKRIEFELRKVHLNRDMLNRLAVFRPLHLIENGSLQINFWIDFTNILRPHSLCLMVSLLWIFINIYRAWKGHKAKSDAGVLWNMRKQRAQGSFSLLMGIHVSGSETEDSSFSCANAVSVTAKQQFYPQAFFLDLAQESSYSDLTSCQIKARLSL